MERKKMNLEGAKTHLGIDENKMRKALDVMCRRRGNEGWIQKTKTKSGQSITYLYLEGIVWIEEVYFRDCGNYIDAEIQFELKQIARLQEELQRYDSIQITVDLSHLQLQQLLRKSKQSISNAIKKMIASGMEDYKLNRDGVVIITASGINWLLCHYYKKEYLNMLTNYKHALQAEKRNRR